MRLDLAFEEVLPHLVDAVWGQLTDAAPVSEWLMETSDFRPEVGGTRLRLTHESEIDPVLGRLLREGWPSRIELLRRSL